MTFEEFIRSTRPPYLIFLDKNSEGAFVNEKTTVLHKAWQLGVTCAPFNELKTLLVNAGIYDATIDDRDPKCFFNNRVQRHYWCYLTGKGESTGKINAPFLSELLDSAEFERFEKEAAFAAEVAVLAKAYHGS